MQRNLFIPLVSGLLLLMALLSACGSDNTASSSAPATAKTPAATAAKTVASTPTANGSTTSSGTPTGSCNVTYGCGVGSSNLTPYQGNGYTINYPGSWVIKSDGSSGNIFSMPDGSASLHVFVQDSASFTNPLQYEFGTLAKDNCKAVGNGMQTVQVNGEAWQQSQFVCMPADNGQAGGKVEQIGILVSTNLHNGKYYSMDYMAGPTTFGNTYQTFFQPMMASFKVH